MLKSLGEGLFYRLEDLFIWIMLFIPGSYLMFVNYCSSIDKAIKRCEGLHNAAFHLFSALLQSPCWTYPVLPIYQKMPLPFQ